jgi:hypothetical protein
MEILTGSTPDISSLLSFQWWEPVGISEHVGHAMTYMILTDDTQKIKHQSHVRTALDPLSPNKRVDPPSGEDYQPPLIIKLRSKESDEVMDENGELQTRFYQLPLVDTSHLIGRTFLTEQDNGQKHRT